MTEPDLDLEIRTIHEDEFAAWERSMSLTFSEDTTEARLSHVRNVTEIDRAIGAFSEGAIVGTAAAYSFELTIPGGPVPCASVDSVATLPTHRRRGVLTGMMRNQMADFHERGEALAMLHSSESSIYGRFGYGIATWSEEWTIASEHTGFTVPLSATGQIRFVEREEVGRLWPAIYERVRPCRVGLVRFTDALWTWIAADPEFMRHGASALFHVVYEVDGMPEGFASYRVRDGTVLVVGLIGTTAIVEAALWRFCFGIDLMTSTRAFNRPPDDPLPWMLADPRKLQRSTRDHLWLRLVDVRAALSMRAYASEIRAVISVDDGFCPWNAGAFELEAGPEGASCTLATRSPDIALSAADLAAVYLGGTTLLNLSLAGRVRELTSGTIAVLDRAMATPRLPWTLELREVQNTPSQAR